MYTQVEHFQQKSAISALSMLFLVKGPRLFQKIEIRYELHISKACLSHAQKFGTAVGC